MKIKRTSLDVEVKFDKDNDVIVVTGFGIPLSVRSST
jgi:hypothetical protein